MYGIMTGIGLLVMYFLHGNLATSLYLGADHQGWLDILAMGSLCAGILLCISYLFEGTFASFRQLKELVRRLLGPTKWPVSVYLALLSAFGEELLFRGAIQPALGLVLTSIIFGLMHLGPDGRISSWSIWALLAGLLMGWLYEQSGQLWSSILAHFLVNLISLLRLQREFAQRQKHEPQTTGPHPESRQDEVR